jgi:quercetin dioxygenase-like cupin family protein
MKKVVLSSLLIFCTVLGYSQTDSLKRHEQRIVTPDEIVWEIGPPTLPPGAKFFLIEGHPMKEGPIIMRLRLPAGYIIPAHFHPGAERATVLSGKYNIGVGEKFDKLKCKELPAGSVAIMPPGGIPHFGYASEETIIQVHIDGPLQITYVKSEVLNRRMTHE